MPDPENMTLFTIGHSNLSAEEFIAHLRRYNITVLVDVRSAPYSRYVPHFNKSSLGDFLQANGVDYRYAGEFLGGQPKDETVYKNEVVPDDKADRSQFLKKVQYHEVMKRDWYQKGIRRLLDIVREAEAEGGAVAIMCSEGSPLDCHRHHLIARSLLDPAVRITDETIAIGHILRNGDLESVEASAFTTQPILPHQPRLL